MSKTGRLVSVLAVVLVGVVVPAGARAAAWARTERGVRAFELVSPVDQQVLVRGSHVRLRLVLLPGASLKAVIVPGYRTARLTARLRSAEVPIGGGRRLIKAVVGGLPRGPSLLSFVTTLWGQTAGQQVVVNRVLPARVIAALGMVKVARGHAPVVRLLPSKLAVSVTAKLNGHDISQSFAQGALKFVQGLVPPGVRPAGDHRPVRVPDSGTLTAKATLKKHGIFGSGTASPKTARTVVLKLSPGKAARSLLDSGHMLRVTITLRFTPRGGTTAQETRHIEVSAIPHP